MYEQIANRPNNYKAKKLKKRIILAACAAALVAVVVAIVAIATSGNQTPAAGTSRKLGLDGMKALWEKADYAGLLDAAKANLADEPMDLGSLVYRGIAAFHLGIAQTSASAKIPYLDEAVANLRKALLVSGDDLRPKLEYVLGKAYYHKGDDYTDLAARYLLLARAGGYVADDLGEYLALAYESLGEGEKAIAELEAVPGATESPAMLLRLARSYYTLGRIAKGDEYVARVLALKPDASIEEQAMAALAESYASRGNAAAAERTYLAMIDKRDDDANAHFALGNLYEAAGDLVKARYEWRRALKIDPNHAGARRKLKL